MSEDTKPDELEVKTEDTINFDPKEVEAQLVKMAHERAEDPVETASTTYRLYLPYFKAQMPKMSVRAMRRLVNFLVCYPLEQDDIGAATQVEREMMELTNTLVQAKFVMILATYNQHAEELYKAATTPLTEEEENAIKAELGLDKTEETKVE